MTVDNGVRLLKSFFTGQASLVPRPRLEYMNTVEVGKVSVSHVGSAQIFGFPWLVAESEYCPWGHCVSV